MFGLTPWKKKARTGTIAEPVPEFTHPLARFRNEFEALVDRFFGVLPVPSGAWEMERYWAFDVEDTGKEVIVRAEMPGFEIQEIQVQLSGNRLLIQAEHTEEKEAKEKKGEITEREYAKFERSLLLPEGVMPDNIEAEYHNGVLEVRVPKKPEAQGKRIEVKKS